MNERIGYDELLDSRVKQLREIEDMTYKLEDEGLVAFTKLRQRLKDFRRDVQSMIDKAEAESEAF